MGDQRCDTPGPPCSSDIERNSNRRPTPRNSRWPSLFSPDEVNGANRGRSTGGAPRIVALGGKVRNKAVAQTRDYDSNSVSSDDEQRSPRRVTNHVDYRLSGRSDDRGMGVGSNPRLPRSDVHYSRSISDTHENEIEDTMDLGVSDYERKKEGTAKKWSSIVVEGGKYSRNKPSLRAAHRVHADLDRYEKGAGIINYNITVKKIMKTDSYMQFSANLRHSRKSIPAASTPKITNSSQRSSSWKPSSRMESSCPGCSKRESSPSPRGSVRRQLFSNSNRLSGKFGNSNDFSPSRPRYLSPPHLHDRKKSLPPIPRSSGRRFSSPPQRRSQSSGSYKMHPRNARSDTSFRRVTISGAPVGSYRTSRPSLTRRQENNMTENITSQYTSESPSRRSVPRYGRQHSQPPPRTSNQSYDERQYGEDAESRRSADNWNFMDFNDYNSFMAQDIKLPESFTEQLRKVGLEGQVADNPFSVWDPDSNRWSRDFEVSFDEFAGPRHSTFVEDQDDTSSGSLFSDEMEFKPRRRLTHRERTLLFHTWNPVFYCNEVPGYKQNQNISSKSMTDPRYRVFYD